jgi:hypothetical protein
MTSHELARQLLDGPDLPVHMAYSYGDHWRTVVTPEITSVKEGVVEYSNYHNMDRIVDEEMMEKRRDRGVKDADEEGVEASERRVIILD